MCGGIRGTCARRNLIRWTFSSLGSRSASRLLVSSVFQSNIFLSLQMQPRLANTPESESFEKPHLTHRVLISLYAGLPLCYLSLCMNTRRTCVCLRAASRGCKFIGAFGITWSCSLFCAGKKKESVYSMAKGGGKKAVLSCVANSSSHLCLCKIWSSLAYNRKCLHLCWT